VSQNRERDEALLAPLGEAARRFAEADSGAGPRPEAWHRLRQARDRRLARTKDRRRWTLPAVAVAGLALALTFALTFGGTLARRPRPLTYVVNDGAVEANGYVARVGAAPTELRFSDGTRVQLARGARMSVSAPGPHGARLRVEDGEAHFEVTHRPGADWSVEAGPYRVQVTGTVFDVRWSAGDEAAVALRAGSVRVTGPHLAAPVTLAPGQRFVARLATAEVRLEAGALDGDEASRAAAPAPPTPPTTLPVGPAVSRPATSGAPAPHAARAARSTPASSRPTDAAALAPESWARRVAGGESATVLAEARGHVFDDVIGDVDASALVALADAARYTGEPALAERALTELRRRFASTAEAHTAAFQLGRLADDAGDPRGALAWYRSYAREAPRGPYAAEAFGREMLDVERLSGRAAAAPIARAYLDRFPEGTYLLQARAILDLP
jgi:ferric-dicitrate binding protein FerR (iron transport regulator)